jgi:hypothetical protein
MSKKLTGQKPFLAGRIAPIFVASTLLCMFPNRPKSGKLIKVTDVKKTSQTQLSAGNRGET